MDFSRLKVQNKIFYLDVKNAPTLESQALIYIRKYGGIISPFLDSKVHYILHNGHSSIDKPSHFVVKNETVTPKKTLFPLSRSQRLLAASVKNTPQTAKIRDSLPKLLHCKYLDIKDFLQFFNRIASEESKILKDTLKTFDTNNRLRKLNGRFIKVSFGCGRFRSMFKEFIQWPELDLDFERGQICPFATKIDSLLTPEPAIADNSLERQGTPETSTRIVFDSRPATPCTTLFSTGLPSTTTTPFTNQSLRTTLSRSRKSTNTYKKSGIYCEICSLDFDDYHAHINDPKHIQYLKSSENYQELLNLVQTLPKNYYLS